MKPFPQLSSENLEDLKVKAQQWSLANGLVMYPPDFQTFNVSNAPITLFPTPIPKTAFEQAQLIQQTYNELYSKIVGDKEWLINEIKQLSQFDPEFTGRLFEIYNKVNEQGNFQPLSLGIFRSDYMLHDGKDIKQIEFNTVSVSFGGLSPKINELHTYLNDSGSYDNDYSYQYYDPEELPVSSSIKKIAEGISKGNYYYNDETDNTKTSILFIVQPNERNSFDQRHIEYELLKTHKLKSYRLTLEETIENTTINGDKLYMKKTMDEISVVYYRSGYGPGDYPNEKCWDARFQLENNKAIKCPSIITQLSGTKKIQQILTEKSNLSKYLNEETVDEISKTFVKIYPMDNSPEGEKAKKLAFEQPENFVLKPQREGGGNNIYKEDIPGFLKTLDEKNWEAYILMELINPPVHKNTIIRNNDIFTNDIISELGIFGSIVFDETNGDIKYNEYSGWLLRSKLATSNEGGVAAGFGCVDGIYLY